MRGVGTARAAVSVVNALPLGIGAAIGIDWPAHATANLGPPGPRPRSPAVEPAEARTELVRASARAALERFGGGPSRPLRLRIRSTIPVGRGLKSSSAVSTSVALAVARAAGTEPTAAEVARLAATVGRATGVSATGAYDDALAGLLAGGVVTDNRKDAEIRRFRVDPRLGVALWIPELSHPPSPQLRRRFRRETATARKAVDAALAGDWPRAMELNSSLVERAMGYRYAALHETARRAGAVASGVSGLGPAFAVLAPSDRLAAVVRGLPREGRRRSVRLFAPLPSGGGAA